MAVLAQPRPAVWSTVRDHLPELVPLLGDVQSVTVGGRRQAEGRVHLDNVWRADADIPPVLRAVVSPEMLTWTDAAEWCAHDWVCRWEIRPHFLSDSVSCRGTTAYQEAMAGRGTRMVMEGCLDVRPAQVPAPAAVLAGAIESFVATLIPRNFQSLARAVSTRLAQPPA